MTNQPDVVEGDASSSSVRTSRHALLFAIGLVGLTIFWLVLTATNDDSDWQFFGFWRVRHILVAAMGLWVSVALYCVDFSRRALFRYLFATILAVCAWGLVELVGIVGIVDYGRIFEPHEALGQKAIPNLNVSGTTHQDLAQWAASTDPIEFRYQTDHRGYRNASDLDRAQIYLVGDSILVAGLLPFKDTLTSLVADATKRSTMNIALIGIGPEEEYAHFVESGVPCDHSLVLQFIFEGNDLLDSHAYREAQGRPAPPPPRKLFLSYLLNAIKMKSDTCPPDRYRAFGQIGDQRYAFLWTRPSFANDLEELSHIEQTIADFNRHVVERGGRYAVVFVPAKIRVLGPACTYPDDSSIKDYREHLNPMRDRLLKWCDEQRIDVIDLTDGLAASVQKGDVPWFPYDTHPNAIGHRVMASTIVGSPVLKRYLADTPSP
ncbi:MAG: hypothetical protein GC159_19585 [Phycisphaera sp.]|nr:hypothetical protein [Phycisphaera sp.]